MAELPPELSQSQGRFSRSSRSRAGRSLDVAGQSVGSRDFAQTPSAGRKGAQEAAGLETLRQGFGAFSQGFLSLDRVEEHRDEAKIREVNKLKAKRLATTRPGDVDEALRTGDWSKFDDITDEQKNRGSFLDNLRMTRGAAMGDEYGLDAEAVERITTADNPDAERAKIAQEQTQGMDPLTAEHFLSSFYNKTETLVDETTVSNLQGLSDEAAGEQKEITDQRIADGDYVTMDDHMAARDDAGKARAILGPNAVLKAEVKHDKSILRRAIVDRDSRLLRLIDQPVKEFGGRSLREMYPDYAAQLEAEAEGAVGSVRDAEHKQRIFDLNSAWTRGDITGAEALALLDDIDDEYGWSTPADNLRGSLQRGVADAAVEGNTWMAWWNGAQPPASDVSKHQYDWVRNWGDRMAQMGVTDPRESAARLRTFLLAYPPNSDTKNWLGQQLREGDRGMILALGRDLSPAQRKQMFNPADQAVFAAGMSAERAGKPFDEGVSRALDGEVSDLPPKKQLTEREGMDTATIDAMTLSGAIDAVAIAEAGVKDEKGEIVTVLDQSESFLFGLIPNRIDEDQIDPSVRRRHKELTETFLHLGYADTVEDAAAMASEQLAGELDLATINGKRTVILMPTETRDINGKPLTPLTGEESDGIIKDVEDNALGITASQRMQFPAEDLRDLRGLREAAPGVNMRVVTLRRDSHTAHGKGFQMKLDMGSGYTEELSVIPGELTAIDPAFADLPIFDGFEKLGLNDQGDMVVRAPVEDLVVSSRSKWTMINGYLVLRGYRKEFKIEGVADALDQAATERMGGDELADERVAEAINRGKTSRINEKERATDPGRRRVETQEEFEAVTQEQNPLAGIGRKSAINAPRASQASGEPPENPGGSPAGPEVTDGREPPENPGGSPRTPPAAEGFFPQPEVSPEGTPPENPGGSPAGPKGEPREAGPVRIVRPRGPQSRPARKGRKKDGSFLDKGIQSIFDFFKGDDDAPVSLGGEDVPVDDTPEVEVVEQTGPNSVVIREIGPDGNEVLYEVDTSEVVTERDIAAAEVVDEMNIGDPLEEEMLYEELRQLRDPRAFLEEFNRNRQRAIEVQPETKKKLKDDMKKSLPERVDEEAYQDVDIFTGASADEAFDYRDMVIQASDGRGEFLLDWNGKGGRKFKSMFMPFLEEHEGFVPYVYDDRTGERVPAGKKAKGDPTVGIGYNLKNASARKDLAAVGVDYDDLVAGKVEMTRAQARDLAGIHGLRVSRWLHKHFEGHRHKIPMHRWVALMSLAYNSRWNKSGPTLIGPGLTQATIDGDRDRARFEIEENSAGGVPKSLKRGILNRRKKEFQMWDGNWGQNA